MERLEESEEELSPASWFEDEEPAHSSVRKLPRGLLALCRHTGIKDHLFTSQTKGEAMPRARDAVRTLLPLKPFYAPPDTRLREVAVILRDKDVEALLVRDAEGFGILSERDVVCALTDGADPDEVWAADVMTREVLAAEPERKLSTSV